MESESSAELALGEVFELLVRVAKKTLKAIVGNARLALDELQTAIKKVEALMNSRPLMNRWRLIQNLVKVIWKRWREEYLSTLSARKEWRQVKENLKVEDVVASGSSRRSVHWSGWTDVKSCKELYDFYRSDVSQLVTLRLGSKPVSMLCQMGDFGCGNGGWTPVMKIDGNKTTLNYNAHYWSDYKEYNLLGGETGFDRQETKLPTYWNTSFSKICLGMKIGHQLRFIVISQRADSLYSLIADGQYRNTSVGRSKWKELIGSQASLQYRCNKQGFNAVCTRKKSSKARIGIVSNNQDDCYSCNSMIGFGTGGKHDGLSACGNEAVSSPDNRNKSIKAMGYILVQ
ncbi:uncharacterized skeletal organic matrix protein 5-like [Stylophora pistillata]|uniref:uncharacterized skeletal organic matrix protein 5-like n=1 Tax=Stylophora pistillata TaxID=50429 RepID=UPI000C054BFE|nr:uncharacterized skeletal organic matrix protein 5-like [Stylophora pistillata]